MRCFNFVQKKRKNAKQNTDMIQKSRLPQQNRRLIFAIISQTFSLGNFEL